MKILIIEDEQNLADIVANRLKKEKYIVDISNDGEDGLYNALMDVSKLRRGEAEAGSCLWADVDEHSSRSDFFHRIYQIFGHTQQKKKPVIKRSFADLDCRKAFLIATKGNKLIRIRALK